MIYAETDNKRQRKLQAAACNSRARATLLLCITLLYTVPQVLLAATISPRRDQLSTSAVGIESGHDISFQLAGSIPPSGKIVVSPQAGAFNIPSGLNYQDIDFLVNNVNQSLAASAGSGGGSNLGAAATSGSNGNITITLNDTDGLTAGSQLEIIIGTRATYGAAGSVGITNPTQIGSYSLTINTTDSANTTIDSGIIGLAITNPVGVSGSWAGNITSAPIASPAAGSYAGQVTVSLSSATPGAIIYYTLDGTTPTSSSPLYVSALNLSNTTTVKAFATAPGYTDSSVTTASYTIINTQPDANNSGPAPYAPPPGETTINGITGGTASAQCANGIRISLAFSTLSLQSDFTVHITCLIYSALPFAQQNNAETVIADSAFGISFNTITGKPVSSLQRAFTATIEYTQGQIKDLLPPVTGRLYLQTNTWTAVPNPTSSPTLEAHSFQLQQAGILAVMAKKAKQTSCLERTADLNCDGRVNITDFSILMYWWGKKTPGARADINKDGIVNLVDLSIMLYWWTN